MPGQQRNALPSMLLKKNSLATIADSLPVGSLSEDELLHTQPPLTSFLTVAFPNSGFTNPAFQSKPELRQAYARRVARGFGAGVPHSTDRCVFTGKPALGYVLSASAHKAGPSSWLPGRAFRQHIPLITAEEVINFFPWGDCGLPVSGEALLCLQLFPMGCFKCAGRLLAIHADHPSLLQDVVSLALQENMLALLQARENQSKKLGEAASSAPTRLIETILELSRRQERANRRREPFSITAYHLTNSGQSSPLDERQPMLSIYRERIRTWLDLYLESLEEWRRPHRAHLAPLLVLLRGLLTTADHAASAHLARIPAGIPESWQHLERRLRPLLVARQWSQPGRADPQPYAYQRACAERARQSTLLIAPTGSGKTEAALYWALGDGAQPVPRLFYVLPYQASINAMYQRLSHPSYFGAGMVGLQHGHAFQALYQQLLATEMGPATAREAARWSLNLNRLHAYPLKVLSPYQLLKVLYRIKGFEGMLTDYTQAIFIFDEIHAYDAERLALIVALLQYLQQRYGARMLIMSATLPSLVRQRLIEALALPEPIVAEAELLQRWRRHQLHLLDGDLLEEGWKRVAAQVKQGNMVMACCNTVGRAQRLYQQLRQVLAAEQVLLLHSRFTARDRQVREAQILERTGAGAARQALALVATQVVEVSLNLDVDTIYTDPAPLEALVQRFGRVNRAGSKGIVPVHVFRSPQDGQGIYLPGLVARTLSKLEEYQSQVIDEVALQHWLDAIYEDPELADPWQRSYGEQFELASWLLKQLRPFQAHAHGEEAFAQLFDGMEVLPGRLEQDYRDLLEAGELLEATQLCVPLSYRTYQALVQRHQVRHLPLRARARSGSSIPMVEAPYDPERGLVLPQDAIDRSGS